MLCNGALVSRTTYAALFAVIGTIYGEGDGSTTFAIPNLDQAKIVTSDILPVYGTGMAMGLTDGTRNVGMTFCSSTLLKWSPLQGYSSQYGASIGSYGSADDINSTKATGLVSDSSKTGIVAKMAGVTMRFYIKY